MRSFVVALVLVAAVAVVNGQGTVLASPKLELCQNRPRGWTFGNHNYFFSFDITNDPAFLEKNGQPKKFNWLEARNVCRERCMDAVGIESKEENDMIFDFIGKNNVTYIWTSGRLCDFTGCESRKDLKPLNILGWFWSNTNTKMAPTNKTPPGWRIQPWSQTGHTQKPQPDNAEFDINQTTESCMGVLNNLYKDGIKWHDIACYHKKPVVCEDSESLLNFIFQNNNNGNNNGNNRNNNNNNRRSGNNRSQNNNNHRGGFRN